MQYPQLTQALKRAGQSVTTTRKQVYHVLANNEPLTMQQLTDALPETNRSSVYRTIELFEKLGITQRLHIGWKYKVELSNDFQDHHHHMTCLDCGTVTALPEDELLESRLHQLAEAMQFTAKDHQIELRGTCSTCKARKT